MKFRVTQRDITEYETVTDTIDQDLAIETALSSPVDKKRHWTEYKVVKIQEEL